MSQRNIYIIVSAFILMILPGCGIFQPVKYTVPNVVYVAQPAKPIPAAKVKKYKAAETVTGYGKISKVNGLPRTKVISGYYKSNGKYVKPYARSK